MQGKSAFLVDLDGTLISGRRPLPGARQLLERMGNRWVLLSNDAEHTPVQLSGLLESMGLPIPQERIVLAGTATLDLIAERSPGARVLLLASDSLSAYAAARGLVPVERSAQFVVVARDRRFSYERLAMAANLVRDGAELIAANPDLVHPGPGGGVVPETGALLAAIMACAGQAKCLTVGKPEPPLFLRALSILGVSAHDAIMIGDNAETDGEGAARMGMRYINSADGLAGVLDRLPVA